MGDQLFFCKHAFDLKIHSFVLMSNHYHLIVSAPQANLSQAMAFFQRETSRELTRSSHRENQTWAGRFFRSRLGSYHYFLQAYKYVYQNPLKVGLSKFAEEYPFSTLSGLLGNTRLIIPVEHDTLLFDGDFSQNINWVNRLADPKDWETVRRALRRKEFKLPLERSSRKPHKLETQLL